MYIVRYQDRLYLRVIGYSSLIVPESIGMVTTVMGRERERKREGERGRERVRERLREGERVRERESESEGRCSYERTQTPAVVRTAY